MDNTISVIIPAYNIENYLKRSVESVCSQTHKDMDVIIVDDGSSDNTVQIAKELASRDDRIRVFEQEHSGAAAARLLGIRHAKGTWIGFVDSDDEVDSDMYERLLSNALRYNKRISHCGMQHHHTDGKTVFKANPKGVLVMNRHEVLRKISQDPTHVNIVNKIFHRDLFRAFDNPPELLYRLIYNEDLLINYLLCREADGSVYDGWCPYHYHYRKGSVTKSKSVRSHFFDTIHVRDYIRQTVDREAYIEAQKTYIWSCINMYKELYSDGKEYEEELQLARSLIERERPTFSDLSEDIDALVSLLFYDTEAFRLLMRNIGDVRHTQQDNSVL